MTINDNYSLKNLNTFGIDANARYFASFSSEEELAELLHFHDKHLILGGGSNILFTRDFDGLVLKNDIGEIEIVSEDAHHVYARAGAGVNWHSFVLFCIERELAGVENLSLIPGNVGASPMQNIGAYGVEIKDVFHQLEAYNVKDRTAVNFSNLDCGFGYRESVFKNKYKGQFVILNVTFRLNKIPVFNTSYGAIEQELAHLGAMPSVRSISQAVINIRRSKLPDPEEIGNAGSFFKNPAVALEKYESLKKEYPAIPGYPQENGSVKLAAGWLIEQCGWKGYRKGDAGCHAKQALVLVNYGHARGEDIFELSTRIMESVLDMFDVQMEREVNVV
ncbi:MAG: UDP-N-acetylmuramate dehydrogenase [Chitinophagaceae bacterium]|nr:UDP-N-acetylmuramate dehydrogenase [Chitinophagaceae bacterium]